jgi:putative sigma-54 modulation protein
MDVEITARHVEITDAVKEYARKRLTKLEAGFPNVVSAHVILDLQKYRWIAEIVVQARRHIRLETREALSDIYAAIDAAFDTVEKRLRKSLDKRHNHKANPSLSEVEEKLEAGA